MFVASDQRERLGAGVGHIHTDVQKVFEEPETAKGGGGDFPFPEEIKSAQHGDQQFAQSATQNHDGVTHPSKKYVTAFVDDQIYVVEEEEFGAVGCGVEQEEEKTREPGDSCGWRDRLPVFEFVAEVLHGVRLARS